MASLRRSFFASLNLLTTITLLGVLFIMVNFISSRRYWRKDFSRQQLTQLSPQTLQTLKNLKEPLHIIVFYQPGHRLYDLVKDQLKEYERVSEQVKVEFVDPQQDIARASQLVKDFEINPDNPDALNLVIFQSGKRHKYLADAELAEYDFEAADPMSGPRVKSFKGESAFTSAIINITQTSQTLVWFTTGHGEKEPNSSEPRGLGTFKKLLDWQNFSTSTVNLLEKTEIGQDVKLLIIAGAVRRFTETETAALDKYLEAGGRALILTDPIVEDGLSELLKRWGVVAGNNVVVDPERRLPFVSAANLFVTDYTEHLIVSKMKTLMTLFPLARSVSVAEALPQGIEAESLAFTSPAGWGEVQTSNERFQFAEGEDLKGPVSLAVASERAQPVKTRLVVIGDSDFLVNAQVENVGNRDLVMGSLYWLTEQEALIGISARPVESIKLNLTGAQLSLIFWLSLAGMPALMGLLGACMWLSRRN